jgi:prevent-host-death family protein
VSGTPEFPNLAKTDIFGHHFGFNSMKHVNLSDARARFAELLEEVERGETLVISRDGEPTADAPSPEDERRAEARKAIAQIKEARKTAPRVTVEEILQWRDEGRRF